MKVDINIASVLGALMMIMVGVIGYFLKSIMDKLTEIEKDKNQAALDMAKLKVEVRNLADEQHATRDKMRMYDANIEIFWRDFPKLISDALAPQFRSVETHIESLKTRIDRLEDDIKQKK